MAKSATDAGDSEAAGERLIFQAAERNKGPILEVLKTILPATGRVLEIGAGSGQQTVFFAAHFAALTWQASEPDAKTGAASAPGSIMLVSVTPRRPCIWIQARPIGRSTGRRRLSPSI